MWLSSILVLAVAASDKPKLAVLDVTANGVDPAQAHWARRSARSSPRAASSRSSAPTSNSLYVATQSGQVIVVLATGPCP
jgi:hypothetical protein